MKKLTFTLISTLLTIGAFAQLTISIIANPDTICAGSSTTLTADVSGGTQPYTYTWSNTEITSVITVAPNITTTYIITVSDNNSATNTAQTVITVNPKPNIYFTHPDGKVCFGFCLTLPVTGANTYTWSNGMGSGSAITICPTTAITYTVTGTNTNGCTNVAKAEFTISTSIINVTVIGDTAIQQGQSVTLCASSDYADTYTWNTAQTNACITVNPTVTTTYCVTAEAWDYCPGSDCATVIILGVKEFYNNDVGFKIFPNPANDKVFLIIDDNNFKNVTVKIISTQGQIISEETKENISGKYSRTIDLSTISEGVYYLQLISNKKNIIKKLIITR